MAATAKPDGYTIAQIPITVFRFPFMTKITFDPATDFTYIIGVSGYTFGVVVKDDAPWKTFQDFTRRCQSQSRQDQLRHARRRHQPAHHHGADRQAAGHQVDARAVQGQCRGHERAARRAHSRDGGFERLGAAGQCRPFRLLVTWGAARTKNWPDVPTLREIGIDMVSNSPFGIAGPKGMDPKVVKVLHDAFKKGMEEPSYAAAIAKLDQERSI